MSVEYEGIKVCSHVGVWPVFVRVCPHAAALQRPVSSLSLSAKEGEKKQKLPEETNKYISHCTRMAAWEHNKPETEGGTGSLGEGRQTEARG